MDYYVGSRLEERADGNRNAAVGQRLDVSLAEVRQITEEDPLSRLQGRFGSALQYNGFMARNYPSDDLISLECEISFFSEKPETIGLDKFEVQFCRTSHLKQVVEFVPDKNDVYRDWDKRDGPHCLDRLELPHRKFVIFELRVFIERKDWPKLHLCTNVRLSCRTAEGRIKRFTIGSIRMPSMPAEGIRGEEFMSVQVMPKNFPHHPDPKSLVIMAFRRQEGEMMDLFTIPAVDTRFWNGVRWVTSREEAKVYPKQDDARLDGEAIRIWDKIPNEWMT